MRRVCKFLMVTVPAVIVALLLSMIAVEAWVRLSWNEHRGRPGFYISDPVLRQRLAPNYDGWFAGVPVHVNSLGFRDTREYSLDKSPETFRILVLGDSVTFGHGALQETTYPYLLEQRLKQWRADVDWQVWNLGVPGYNTRQELAYLQRVGPRYDPDLVIVGFFLNDLEDNDMSTEPTLARRLFSSVEGAAQRWLYSYELYKRVLLTMRWQWFTSNPDRRRLESLAAAETLTARPSDRSSELAQRLSEVDRLDDTFQCDDKDPDPHRDRLATRLDANDPSTLMWRRSVAEFQRLHRAGTYRVVFFINMAPNECRGADRFSPGDAARDEAALRSILGDGTPVGSSLHAFLPYRPSQMPGASGHSIGNANRVKADALFDFLISAGMLPDSFTR